MKKVRFCALIAVFFVCCYGPVCLLGQSVPSRTPKAGDVISFSFERDFSQVVMDSLLMHPAFGKPGNYGFEPAKNQVKTYKLVYYTLNPYSMQVARASGLIAVPAGVNAALRIVVYTHGTEVSKRDVPSNPANAEARMVLSAFASQGYVVFMPDYIGKGESPGMHTYMLSEGEAQAAYDFCTAARSVCRELKLDLNGTMFLTGWSQGGHAAMALARLMQKQEGSGVKAVAPIAGVYDLCLAWNHWLLSCSSNLLPLIMAYNIYAYEYHLKIPGLRQLALNTQYQRIGEDIFDTDNIPANILTIFGKTPSQLLKPGFRASFLENNNVFSKALGKNQVYMWKAKVPIRFYYGEADSVISLSVSKTAHDYMKGLGCDVGMVNAGSFAGHSETFLFALAHARKWFDGFSK